MFIGNYVFADLTKKEGPLQTWNGQQSYWISGLTEKLSGAQLCLYYNILLHMNVRFSNIYKITNIFYIPEMYFRSTCTF